MNSTETPPADKFSITLPEEYHRAVASLQPPRWLRITSSVVALVAVAFLVFAGITHDTPNDFRYALLYLALFTLPVLAISMTGVAVLWIKRWREGWFRQIEEESLTDDTATTDDAENSAPAASAPRSDQNILSEEEWKHAIIHANYTIETKYRPGYRKHLVIAAEEGLFFAPIAYFDLAWPWLLFSVTLWALAHRPVHSYWQCVLTATQGMLSGLLILPHGILVHALGHFLHDYCVLAWSRASNRILAEIGY